jgi:hypothetical protein
MLPSSVGGGAEVDRLVSRGQDLGDTATPLPIDAIKACCALYQGEWGCRVSLYDHPI